MTAMASAARAVIGGVDTHAGTQALLAKHNIRLPATQLESDTATGALDALSLPGSYATRLASQGRLMRVLADEIAATEVELPRRLRHHPGYRNLLTVKGIGPVLAAVFVAEIASPPQRSVGARRETPRRTP